MKKEHFLSLPMVTTCRSSKGYTPPKNMQIWSPGLAFKLASFLQVLMSKFVADFQNSPYIHTTSPCTIFFSFHQMILKWQAPQVHPGGTTLEAAPSILHPLYPGRFPGQSSGNPFSGLWMSKPSCVIITQFPIEVQWSNSTRFCWF